MAVQIAGKRRYCSLRSAGNGALVLLNVTGGDARLNHSCRDVMCLPGNECVMLSYCARTRPGTVDLGAAGAVARKLQDSV